MARLTDSTVAIVAPFDDTVKLPEAQTLLDLARYAGRLGLTSDAGGGFERANGAGWKLLEDAVMPLNSGDSVLAVVLEPNGAAALHASSEARFFAAP